MASSIPTINQSFLGNGQLDLEKYVTSELQCTEDYNRQCNLYVDEIVQWLQLKVPLNVKYIMKGGSLSKGTAVRGKADLDMVLFLNDFHSMEDKTTKIDDYVKALGRHLNEWKKWDIIVENPTPFAIKFKLNIPASSLGWISVDLLPAFDNLSSTSPTKAECKRVYREILGQPAEPSRKRYAYSSSLVVLQRDFVQKQPANVKNLIRLVKHWRKSLFQEVQGSKLPTSYPLELITIHTWEEAGSPGAFCLKQGFKALMQQLKNYQKLNVFWEDNYTRRDYNNSGCQKIGGQNSQPFVLDPANPMNNVCARFDTWDTMAAMATDSLDSNLLRSVKVKHEWRN